MNLQENIRRILREETKSVKCKCGWSWKLSEGGDDPYVCHKCGRDNSDNKNGESIQKTIKEESKVPIKVRRRLNDIDWNVEFATKQVVRKYGNPCKLSLSYFIDEVVEDVINSLYWDNFSDMEDNSNENEWVITYHFLVDYIENNFGDKLKQYYHINCGN